MAALSPRPGEHPLLQMVRWSESRIDELRGRGLRLCVLQARAPVDGTLGPREAVYLRVRHEPFSVYMRYLAPAKSAGQEVLYVAGQNGDKLKAHVVGVKSIIGTRNFNPTGRLAMRGNRYPITEIGVLNLTERLIAYGRAELKSPDCLVNLKRCKVAGVSCTCIELLHPHRDPAQPPYQRGDLYRRRDQCPDPARSL